MQSSIVYTAEHLNAIIGAIPTAVIVADRQGVIVLTNPQAERLFRYARNELLGEMVDILVPFRYRAKHPELRGQFIKMPAARPMGEGRDLFGLRKDGTEFPIEIGLSPVTADGELFVVSSVVDISERKRLEARFRATIEAAPTAIVMIDQAGSIVLVNAELERLFGYGRDELLRQKIEVLLPERYRAVHPGLRSQYFAAPAMRRMGAGRELFGRRKDGSEFPVEIGLNPVTTDEGAFVLSAIVDISEREQTKTLQRAVEALERSNAELQRFAYVASHDLQTPLRGIASFAGLLQSRYAEKLDKQGQDWLRRVADSARQLQTLIRDLLEYSRIDTQARPFEPIPFREVFDGAMLLLDAQVRETGAQITCGELPVVFGDRSQLMQLLLNLLGNSLKYRSADTPRIHLSAERENNQWQFTVSDNGIGIAPSHRERIFGVFQRLHNQSEYPGTGIGLAVCRRVVHRHGGRVWADSASGTGSNFCFTIQEETGGNREY